MELAENLQGVLEYQTRYSKFQSVGNITLHFPESFRGDTTQIRYIGFKGEATQARQISLAEEKYEEIMKSLDRHLSSNYRRRCEEATKEGTYIILQIQFITM